MERPGGLERNLCRRFGIEMADDGEVPAGALSLLAEGAAVGEHFWFRADPVHLHADRDRLVMFALNATPLSGLAAGSYVDAFNRHFSGEGWQLFAPRPMHWYLRAPRPLAVRTRPLRQVDGSSVEPSLPSSSDARVLRRLMAEAEMLMHESLSADRVDTPGGQAPNSLWVSGGGALPGSGKCRLTGVVADDLLVRGLARNAGIEVASPAQPVTRHGRILWYRDVLAEARRSGDAATYAIGLRQLAVEVAAALTRAGKDELNALCLSDGVSRRWCASARQLKRWWRRRKEFPSFFE
jgi:hypothetical protein